MHKIISGLVEFKSSHQESFIQDFPDLVSGQNPMALLIVCCDSRIMPTISTRIGPGDLFVLRNIGNLIPPYDFINQGNAFKHSSVVAALEFALLYLNVPNIIICGHSECGAMKYLLDNKEVPDTPFLHNWISEAKGVYNEFIESGTDKNNINAHNVLSRLNVIHQLDNLQSFPIVKERLNKGTLQINGWWLDISNYNVFHYMKDTGEFLEINETSAPEIIKRLYSFDSVI